MCPFEAGDEVTCVESGSVPPDWPAGVAFWDPSAPLPTVGAVYTIKELRGGDPTLADGWTVALVLRELDYHCACCGKQLCYPFGWFRKVEKTKTSEFEKLVAPYREKTKEPVKA